jgi:hypothetical protein
LVKLFAKRLAAKKVIMDYYPLSARELVDRRDRAFQQRIYLINTVWSTNRRGGPAGAFGILGTTKTVYVVKVDEDEGVKCTCPDFHNRGPYCKHALFVLLRVLKVPFNQLVFNLEHGGITDTLDETTKRALMCFSQGQVRAEQALTIQAEERGQYDLEMEEAMINAAQDEQNQEVTRRKTRKVSAARPERVEVSRRPIADECAICFEDLDGSEELVYCRYGCGQNLHQDCLNKWANMKNDVTCVYCRSPWF